MLGFYVTGHPLREHARPLELFTSFRLDRVPDDPARRREVWIGGLLAGLRVQNTKKGDLMARASLEDLGGSLDIVFFPKTYAKFSALLQADKPVLVKGNVGGEPERPELHADEILPLADAWNQRTSRIVVEVAADELQRRAAARAAPRARPRARHGPGRLRAGAARRRSRGLRSSAPSWCACRSSW